MGAAVSITRLDLTSVHELERLVAHVEPGEDSEAVHLRRRGRTNPMEFADRKLFHERRSHLRQNHVLPVRVGGEFRQKLIVGDAG
jgi:hypothetical protein